MAESNSKSPTFYEVAIMTRPASVGGVTPGHAMMTIAAPGKRVEAWGFYPDWGDLPQPLKGRVVDETTKEDWAQYTRSTIFTITTEQYQRLKATIRTWEQASPNWIWPLRDCRTFVVDILKEAGINVTLEGSLPDSLGEGITKVYGESWGMCLGRNAAPRKTAVRTL